MKRCLDSDIWGRMADLDWSSEQRLVFLHLWLHPEGVPAGAFRVSPSAIAFHCGLSRQKVEGVLPTLQPLAYWEHDRRIVFLPGYVEIHALSPDARRGAVRHLERLCAQYPGLMDGKVGATLALPWGNVAARLPQPSVSVSVPVATVALPDPAGSADARAPAPTVKERKPRPESLDRRAAAERVVLYHAEVMEKAPVADKASVKLVEDILRQGFTEDQCRLAVDGCKASDFHMGFNEKRERYNNIRQIFGNGDKTKGHIERAEKGPQTGCLI